MTHYEKYQAIYTVELGDLKLGTALNNLVESVKEKGNHQFVEIHQIIQSGTKEYTAILNIYDKK